MNAIKQKNEQIFQWTLWRKDMMEKFLNHHDFIKDEHCEHNIVHESGIEIFFHPLALVAALYKNDKEIFSISFEEEHSYMMLLWRFIKTLQASNH